MKREITSDELKEIQLRMLKMLHRFCEEKGLVYYLVGGTLIGSIRHKGYIPWDDDIDVAMPRSDYTKLLCTFNTWAKQNCADIEFISFETCTEYYLASAKLIDRRTDLLEKVENPIPIGVYIDIFVLDNMSDDYGKAIQLYRQTELWRAMLSQKNRYLKSTRFGAKKIIHYILKCLCFPFKRSFLIQKICVMAQMYASDSFSRYLCNVSVPTYGINEIAESSLYSERLLSEFEGELFYIPAGYDTILRQNYGDYMKLPPEEKRITHHAFTAWWK